MPTPLLGIKLHKASIRISLIVGILISALACSGSGPQTPASHPQIVLFAGALTGLGSGNDGYQDGLGTQARFRLPMGLVVDADKNLLVADCHNSLLRRITPSGAVTTLAGRYGFMSSPPADGPALQAEFWNPSSVAVALSGNIYVTDTLNSTIRKISPSGIVSTYAGTPGNVGYEDGLGPSAKFLFPASLAVDAAEFVYVADAGNNTIRRIDSTGNVTTFAGTAGVSGQQDGQGKEAKFNEPSGIAIDGYGNIFVADSGNHRICKITSSGFVSTFSRIAGEPLRSYFSTTTGLSGKFSFAGIAADNNGNIYSIEGSNSDYIRKFDPNGNMSTIAGPLTASLPGSLGAAIGLAIGPDGKLFITTFDAVLVVTP